MSRPEHSLPPQLFYDKKESRKYNTSSRIQNIQHELTTRAIELLAFPPGEKGLILDIGCGSGLSGAVLTEAGFPWIGTDISKDMLDVNLEDDPTAKIAHSDMGQVIPFRSGVFDGCISIPKRVRPPR